MSIIKFYKNGSLLECQLEPEGHRIRIKSAEPIIGIKSLIEEGFAEINEHSHAVMADFADERYLYHEEEKDHVFVITNEEDDKWTPQPFVAPLPAPPAEPHVPTLEEAKISKIAEMESIMNSIISSGVTVTLSDGTDGTFSLNQEDQVLLTNLMLMAEKEADKDEPSIPWHEADESKQCKFYTANDILLITEKARELMTYNITFFRDLRIYIRSLGTVDAVNAVTYDLDSLPQSFWSEVLRAIVNN